MAITKKFGGKVFEQEKVFQKKKNAQKYATLRRHVRNARVIKEGYSWSVYVIKRN